MVNNFLMGGKLGDFLHAMFAVKHICKEQNIKANIYMYDIGWEFGINNTYLELKPIMLNQDYVNSFNILENYELDQEQTSEKNSPIKIYDYNLLSNGYIDLGSYIRSEWLYKTCWSELYSKTFNFSIDKDYSWIKYSTIDEKFIGKVLIHRRNNPIRMNNNFPYLEILERYKDNILFISSSDKDYEVFPYKENIPFLKVNTLDQWFTAINSCSLIISNLSSPAVMAHAIDKLRIIELPNVIDIIHTVGEEKYSKNIHWYLDNDHHNL